MPSHRPSPAPLLPPALLAAALLLPSIAAAQAVAPGRWDVTSKVVDLSIPGLPGFLARMARGRTTAEHKRLAPGEGIEALLLPDPKAKCRVEAQQVAAGRYAQTLACPQKQGGEPLRITRAGSWDAGGFTGEATVTGTTPKGPMRVALQQRAARVGG